MSDREFNLKPIEEKPKGRLKGFYDVIITKFMLGDKDTCEVDVKKPITTVALRDGLKRAIIRQNVACKVLYHQGKVCLIKEA